MHAVWKMVPRYKEIENVADNIDLVKIYEEVDGDVDCPGKHGKWIEDKANQDDTKYTCDHCKSKYKLNDKLYFCFNKCKSNQSVTRDYTICPTCHSKKIKVKKYKERR